MKDVADNTMKAPGASDPNRRDFLLLATGAAGAVAVGGVAWPLISQMNPDASTIAAGAPVEVDLAPIGEGKAITLKWRGKPIFVRHRTAEEIASAKKDDAAALPDKQADAARVRAFPGQGAGAVDRRLRQLHPSWLRADRLFGRLQRLVLPVPRLALRQSGRIRKGPAPRNLDIPEFAFLSASKIRIG